MPNQSMYDLSAEWAHLLDIAEQGFDPETGEVLEPDALAALWDKVEGEVEDKAISTAYVVRRLELQEDNLKAEAKRLVARAKQQEAHADRLRARLAEFLTTTGQKRVKSPGLSVSLLAPRSRVSVVDAERIPRVYWVTPEPRLDRVALKADLKRGEPVHGAMLVEGEPSVSIR